MSVKDVDRSAGRLRSDDCEDDTILEREVECADEATIREMSAAAWERQIGGIEAQRAQHRLHALPIRLLLKVQHADRHASSFSSSIPCSFIFAFNFAIMTLFVFPYHANFEGRTRDVFRNARLMSWRHPLTSLVSLAVIALAVVVTVFYPQATGYGMLWLLAGFAGIATVNGRLFALVFAKYIAAQNSPQT